MRYAKKIDANQQKIVEDLRQLPGVTVVVDKDDILLGFRNSTFWYEFKNPDKISKKTGELLESSKTKRQKELDKTYTGHRRYITTFEEILADITKRAL
jgi:hypothetical protein